ncbi:hypothetical protein BC643_0031 [Mangrovibacterium diazotrophicum]|uniref:Uncharacterized protein n=1 Tax=Mangrovibacterium diazotrophicum TaxID=1261403 RepID=A0A419W318_9BACT|nr:hypothetical protein BC643_0031 [Mangrovibacterium diazotrophicum]
MSLEEQRIQYDLRHVLERISLPIIPLLGLVDDEEFINLAEINYSFRIEDSLLNRVMFFSDFIDWFF